MAVETNPDAFLWVEKYRPSDIDEVILPKRLVDECKSYIKDGQIPTLMMAGGSGIGKTTIAKALAHMIGVDFMMINASSDNGIDTIRYKITQFASTVSMEGNLKVVLMDEFDGMSTAAQMAMKNLIEEFHQNTRFIFTCNFKNKIIDAIQSRAIQIDFSTTKEEKAELTGKALKRAFQILDLEKVEYDKMTVASIVKRFFPDMRRVLNALQKAAASGKIDAGSISETIPTDALFASMKAKKFGEVRKWVAENYDAYQGVYRDIYDRLLELFEGASIPEIVILLDMYQDRATRVADPEISFMACLTEIMASANWK